MKYEIRYTYDSQSSSKKLKSLMEADRIKWLKDLAKEFSKREIISNYDSGGGDGFSPYLQQIGLSYSSFLPPGEMQLLTSAYPL